MECTGKIISVPCKQSDVWSSQKFLLCSGGDVVDVVSTDHLTLSGDWYVVGDKFSGVMEDDMFLAHPYFKSEEGLYPLKDNQWKPAIKAKEINSEVEVTCVIDPSPFKTGYFNRMCRDCGCHFTGSKSQNTCEQCSEKLRTARIVSSKAPIKPKRPRIRKYDTI